MFFLFVYIFQVKSMDLVGESDSSSNNEVLFERPHEGGNINNYYKLSQFFCFFYSCKDNEKNPIKHSESKMSCASHR